MESFNAYVFIIAASIVVIVSYFFNIIARRINVPSVLLLILLGIIINQGLSIANYDLPDLNKILEIVGIIGLILIVLEASFDLELSKDKRKIMLKAFGVAIITLLLSIVGLSFLLQLFLKSDLYMAVLYAIPIATMSSAVLIPSVSNLFNNEKKEFLIYESTFSDILGIMFFYLVLEGSHAEGIKEISVSVLSNVLLTVIISAILAYLLIIVLQNLKGQLKLFLLIFILIMLYSVGKLFHLSSLLIILTFGIVIQNRALFFKGFLKKYLIEDRVKEVFSNLKLVTLESSFIVRTFFFVIFGMTISLASLVSFKVLIYSLLLLGIIYGIRYFIFLVVRKHNFALEVLIAPRGLITILLFYSIPAELQLENFNPAILMLIIIFSSILMAIGLVKYNKKEISTIEEDIRDNSSPFEFENQT